MRPPLTLVVHNVRSTHNVGSILRTGDAAGVTKVYLCGTTPTPVDRFGRNRNDIAKVALGAEHTVAWEGKEDIREVIADLRAENVRIVALEQSDRSIPYTELALDQPTALVLGEEVHGIPEDILALCDVIVEIPMHGAKESLNVSVSAGIALFSLLEHRA